VLVSFSSWKAKVLAADDGYPRGMVKFSKCLSLLSHECALSKSFPKFKAQLNPTSSRKLHQPLLLLGLVLEALRMNGAHCSTLLHCLKRAGERQEPWAGIYKVHILVPGFFVMLAKS
jgi:hypothetical protein